MFDERMVASIREDTSRMLLTMELRRQPPSAEQVAKPTRVNPARTTAAVKKQPARRSPSRDAMTLSCGSSKKFKNVPVSSIKTCARDQ